MLEQLRVVNGSEKKSTETCDITLLAHVKSSLPECIKAGTVVSEVGFSCGSGSTFAREIFLSDSAADAAILSVIFWCCFSSCICLSKVGTSFRRESIQHNIKIGMLHKNVQTQFFRTKIS